MNVQLSKPVHILLVDDSPTNLKVLSEALHGQGWKTLMATDGESAIEQAEYAQPDLILLDVMMPGIDGFETCLRLKAHATLNTIPVIFMTALSEADYKVKGLELGAVDYITKPFQQTEVIARAKLHLQLSFLHQSLEQQVHDRTSALSRSLEQLQHAQLQLVQNEKMAMLGQLVAGIGHEINNPINFISGNLSPIEHYIQDLFQVLEAYQATLPDANESILDLLKTVDLDYIRADLPKAIQSMQDGVARLQGISAALRTFARSDSDEKVRFEIHDGIESTLMLLQHRLKASEQVPEVQVVRQYSTLPPVRCYPGPLNQVFMNLVANALDAFEDMNQGRSYAEIKANPNILTIATAVDSDQNQVTIRVQDNALGMSSEVQARIFKESFTTKPVGKGTGLGLAISRQIVVDKHGGDLSCRSSIGKGTTFLITLPL